MKLYIEDFTKISNADLLFDGLTVIVGKNNSGTIWTISRRTWNG